jgi:hypothetical protein
MTLAWCREAPRPLLSLQEIDTERAFCDQRAVGKGEVVRSIPTGSTTPCKAQHSVARLLPWATNL